MRLPASPRGLSPSPCIVVVSENSWPFAGHPAPWPAWPPRREAAPAWCSAWRRGPRCRAGGKNVVDQQDIPSRNRGGSETANAPRTLSRRMRGPSPAWLSVARNRISVLEASVSRHSGWLLASELQRLEGQRPRLVKATLQHISTVQRNRNHQHLGRGLAASCAMACASMCPAGAPPGAAGRTLRRESPLSCGPGIGPKEQRGERRRRHAAHPAKLEDFSPASARPCRRSGHTDPLRAGNSVQQTSQIGTGRAAAEGEPQREQGAGRRAQLKASMGLRSTRTTARHREVPDGGTSIVSEPESLRKTHLNWRRGMVKRP